MQVYDIAENASEKMLRDFRLQWRAQAIAKCDEQGCRFDPATHTYSIKEETVPSVNQILETIGVIRRNRHSPGRMERDTVVRQAIEFDIDGSLDEGTLDAGLRGYLTAWRRFRKEVNPIIVATQLPVYFPRYRYAGNLDLLVRLPAGGDAVILDVHPDRVPMWVGLRLAGYGMALDVSVGVIARHRYALQLKPDGNYTVWEFKGSNDGDVFRSCVTVYYALQDLTYTEENDE